ncbi:MAG: hypothetical protein M3501_08130 [Actinomycetota bacterium]|nr:hypothetical protein [Actinomycetota bacterium]
MSTVMPVADSLPLAAVPLAAVPLDAVPLDAVPLDAVPLDAVPLDAVPLEAVPLGAVPLADALAEPLADALADALPEPLADAEPVPLAPSVSSGRIVPPSSVASSPLHPAASRVARDASTAMAFAAFRRRDMAAMFSSPNTCVQVC